ncbi:hypothetical protein ACFFWA_28945 [Actinomadura verrucosospora]|uniref:hypothetical protein n=1 Tax=Actinomadura verrucosospora TaxID=46165 RepID=UPI0031EFCC8A
MFAATGLSINQFARLHPVVNKGTLSRYLNGHRVPRERWLLDQLLARLEASGKPVTPEVCKHLNDLQLRALETAHPHEYRLRLVSDKLELTVTQWHEAVQYAEDLEQQLNERNRQIKRLSDEREQLRTAWDDERAHLEAAHMGLNHEIADLREEISFLRDQLCLARDQAVSAERQYQQLEAYMDDLEAEVPGHQGDGTVVAAIKVAEGQSNGDRLGRAALAAWPEPDQNWTVAGMLARQYAFRDLAAMVAQGMLATDGRLGGRQGHVATLCAFGQRVLDLDAEDFGMPEEAGEVPRDLLDRARASRMPQAPRERPRGALASLRPAYRLLLEVIAIHWHRRDMAALVAAVHIAGEYLPMLAWEPVLGHAGDPALIGSAVRGEGSRFGVPVEPESARMCDHTRPERAACERTLRVAKEPPPGWRAYLDRHHSQVSAALGDCAARCRTPCTVMTRLDDHVRADLSDRCRLATDFTDGALVKLRHAAPVGHGFGVPSPEEVQAAWTRARKSLSRHPLGKAVLREPVDEAYPLSGLPILFSTIAGATIAPDTLLRDTTTRIIAAMETDGP